MGALARTEAGGGAVPCAGCEGRAAGGHVAGRGAMVLGVLMAVGVVGVVRVMGVVHAKQVGGLV